MTGHARGVLALMGWVVGCAPVAAAPPSVRPGIEVLLADSAHLVRGRRVGLVTNHTGVDRAGVGDVERLRAAGVQLVALYSPEHGFRGAAAPGELVASVTDSATGLPIYSLYGRTRTPTSEMLAGVDLLLVDLMDVGARYFTYLSTTIEVLRAAAAAQVPVVVLDRPNPLGAAVQGNVLDSAFRSFVGPLAMPMRHGLTLGELAGLARHELGLATVSLSVVPAAGWRRSQRFEQTGLPWVPPSPNLTSLEALFHYPGTCLFEGTNLSVGRGTDAAFRQLGAPWLDPARVLARLGAEPGVTLAAVRFTPRRPGDGKYADTALAGIELRLTDPDRYDATATAVRLLAAIRAVHADRFAWIAPHFDRLAGTGSLRRDLDRGLDPDAITAGWAADRGTWMARRAPYLLYPD
ncbi:MAG: DUF1343 domain-containing protein [Gemmatimonadales bacterium]|nr:DUF1343 domain-containing protein [Gemmatimonadales bacterium]